MKEYKNGDKVKINKNDEDIIRCCVNCSMPKACSVKGNLDSVFTIKLNYNGYSLLYKDKKSGCYFLPKHFLPAMKWIRMK